MGWAVKPLGGVQVIDMTEGAQGPFAVGLLSDLGAEVIKVERQIGDFMRESPPTKDGAAIPFSTMNRGRIASLRLDLKTEGGHKRLISLVQQCDIFVQNWRNGVAESLRLSFEELRQIQPKIAYVSASGFGTRGPLAPRGSYDFIAAVEAGLGSVSGPDGGQAERYRGPLLDFVSAMVTAETALVTYYHTLRTGSAHVGTTSQFESGIMLSAPLIRITERGGEVGPIGTSDRWLCPSSIFVTQDKQYVAIQAETPEEWSSLCQVLKLATPAQWETLPGRLGSRHAVEDRLRDAVAARQSADVLRELRLAGVPAAPVRRTAKDAVNDPELCDEHIVWRRSDSTGWVCMPNSPWRFQSADIRPGRPCPPLGQALDPDWEGRWRGRSF
jgi:crotonobetainyl-CoA:carnitine CoA-transferase CaiB-like acyl-CoA transferase